jgi:hypothetical protein
MAASDLTVLIRLHKHELDEKRRALIELQLALTQLERERRDLDHAFELEKEAVDKAGDIHFTFGKYAERVQLQKLALDARKAALQKQIDAAKEVLMLSFSELKKYELTQKDR